jgi:methylase of polypeptide subunit release factors
MVIRGGISCEAAAIHTRFMSAPTSPQPPLPQWWQRYVRPLPGPKGVPSVYAKTLCEALPRWTGSLLDLGCGSGIIGIHALVEQKAKKVTFLDSSKDWLHECQQNVSAHIHAGTLSEQAVSYRHSNFEDLTAEEITPYDWIIFNPPQLPTAHVTEAYKQNFSTAQQRQFRFGGHDGLEKIRAFVDWFSNLELGPHQHRPNILLLLSSFPGRQNIEQIFEESGLSAVAVHEKRVPLRDALIGAALRFSAEELEDRGLQEEPSNPGRTRWTKQLSVYHVTVNQPVLQPRSRDQHQEAFA